MNKISLDAALAFKKGRFFKRGTTVVEHYRVRDICNIRTHPVIKALVEGQTPRYDSYLTLHSTIICKLHGDILTIKDGGWPTRLTASRINAVMHVFDIPYVFHVRDFQLYVKTSENTGIRWNGNLMEINIKTLDINVLN